MFFRGNHFVESLIDLLVQTMGSLKSPVTDFTIMYNNNNILIFLFFMSTRKYMHFLI